jgi:hypothetical protein
MMVQIKMIKLLKPISILTNKSFHFRNPNCVHEDLFIGLRASVNSLGLIQVKPLLTIDDIIIEVFSTWSQYDRGFKFGDLTLNP